MRFVPLYDGDENVGSAPFTSNLDTWDGIRWRHLQTGCHLGVGRLDDGTYEALFRYEDDFGPAYLAVVITEEEAKELVKEYKEEMHEELFFWANS